MKLKFLIEIEFNDEDKVDTDLIKAEIADCIALDQLPEPDMSHRKAIDDNEEESSYSAESMIAYALCEVLKERARCSSNKT